MSDSRSKKGYRPRLQEWPGYKTVVDQKSQLGILPEQTESSSIDRGQSNLDSTWPVKLPQTREKERALPLPSNHDKKREKRIGPTNYNKPRKVPYRTLSVPGEQYGHPTKYDYNYVTRRPGVTAMDDVDFEDYYEEDPIDDQLEPVGSIFPKERQKNQGAVGRRRSRQHYLRNKERKKRKERQEYKIDKRMPRQKLKRKYRRMYPNRYKRKGIDPRTPAQKAREWRQNRAAGLELLGEVQEVLGANWPSNWNTHVKQTVPPEQLDQNFGKGQSRGEGTPRKDPGKQKGESLRAPDLSTKKQKGLRWELEPPASGGLDYPVVNTMNPTDGSGKVIPMSYYTDMVNNTQAVPDSRQERYLHNNNFEVKQAATVGEILRRCDRKIKERSKEQVPKLRRTDTKNWTWHWDVGDHRVKVQALKRGNAKNFPKLNLRVSCTCPFWRWWGPEHWGTKANYQKGKLQGTGAYPKERDPARWRPVCKHAYAVLEKSMPFFVRPKKSPLKKLSSRFFVDSPDELGIEIVQSRMAAQVAQCHLERQISRRVVARYLAREDR